MVMETIGRASSINTRLGKHSDLAQVHSAGQQSWRNNNTPTHATNPASKPHSAGRGSGRSRNTPTHATNPAGQTALGRLPVREEPQHIHAINSADETTLKVCI